MLQYRTAYSKCTIHNLEALISFDASKQTPGVQLYNDCFIARQSSEDQKWEWVLCAVPSDRFEVRVRCNPKHMNLFIGFTESDSSLVDWMETSRNSWFIATCLCQIYECGKWGPAGKSGIQENAVVSVTKDFSHRALVFNVDGNEPCDNFGKPYGRRQTSLCEEKFAALVGIVAMFWKNDEVEIAQ